MSQFGHVVYYSEDKFDESFELGKQSCNFDSEHRESDEFIDDNSLPLCYAAFELIKDIFKLAEAV